MIIRKPYAFLIKHFKKIHVLLSVLGIFIFYKTIRTFLFVNDFMGVGLYDLLENPIAKHINGLFRFSVFIVIIGCLAILLLLRHKKKPWKAYLTPLIVYVVLFFTLLMVSSFFRSYTEFVDSANLRLARDLLFMLLIGQVPSLGVFLMRLLGLDLKKFSFDTDLENLEFSDEDYEEVEINLDIDVNAFKRVWRKFLRYSGYFYKEHKIICCTIIGIISFILIYNLYVFLFVVNRTYRQGQLYNADGYTIKVVNSYYTDKDDTGEKIAKKSNFVIIDLIVKNNGEDRAVNVNNFHLKSGMKSYDNTENVYQDEFSDLGSCYSKVKILKKGEETRFIIIYKVNKSLLGKKAVFYYQEKSGIYKLRKIRLKMKDIRKLDKPEELKLGDMFLVTYKNYDENLGFDSAKFVKSVTYRTSLCNTLRCDQSNKSYSAPKGYSILTMDFASDVFEAQNMIDFLTKYGKIIYKDSKGKQRKISVENAVKNKYYGKVVYIKVADEVASSSDISIRITIRNKVIMYKLS